MEPRNRAVPGRRRAPHTRKAPVGTPLWQVSPPPAGSEPPGMPGNTWCGPREALPLAWASAPRPARRTQKGHGRAARGQGVGPLQSTAEASAPPPGWTARAEDGEGRAVAKGKTGEPPRGRPQRRSARHRARDRRRQAARRDHAQPLPALWPHGDESNRRRAAVDGLHHAAAPGVAGEPWAASGETLEATRRDLSDRRKRGGDPARPGTRVSSPPPEGRPRPLGLPALEATSVQRATVAVRTASDEGEWRGFASGSRPGRRPHEALAAVTVGREKRPGTWGLDADIRGGFAAIDHAGLGPCSEPWIGAQRVGRHRQHWRPAGVREAGPGHAPVEGPPPGGSGSPWAAHRSLPDVLDRWAARGRRHDARGEGSSGRDADECRVGVAPRDAAERCWSARRDRRGPGQLARHPETTRRIACGRVAAARRQRRAPGQPAPVAVLGLTPLCRQTRHGTVTVRRQPLAPRLRTTRPAGKDPRRRRLHWPSPPPGAWRKRVLLGHDRSDAVPRQGSLRTVCRATLRRDWCQRLRRRRQRHRTTGPRLDARAEPWRPTPPLLHPYPAPRLCVTPRGKSPVRECRTPGSGRGASGNGRPYRDPRRRTPQEKSYAT